MKKRTVAVVLLASLCISMAAPMDTDAALFLAAVPVIWAVALGSATILAALENDDDAKQTQQAAKLVNEPTLNESPPQIANAYQPAVILNE